MPLLPRLRSLWRNLARRGRAERRLDEEVRAYAALLEEEKVAAGMEREAARRAALLELGGVEQVKEAVREVRMGAQVEATLKDVRYGLRGLRRTPGFTAAAVVALALGIGATTAIFSVVDAVLLRPLPYRDPERLLAILHKGTGPVSPADFLEWRKQATRVEAMGAAEYWQPNVSGRERPERVLALRVTPDVLPLLGVPPRLGRVFAADEDRAGRDKVVVLGHRIWQRRYGGDPGVLGRSLTLDGEPHTIVGVMPAGFEFPPFWAVGAEMWAPLPLADRATNRGAWSLRVFARVREGVRAEAAGAEAAAVTARLDEAQPRIGAKLQPVARPLTEAAVGRVRPALVVLLGAVAFVLLIACANVAHMLLARAAAREKEIALRSALGAGRGRIVRQLLTESLVLALLGGAAGLGLAAFGLRALVALGPEGLPRLEAASLDARVLAATAAVSLLTGIVFGLFPALQASRRDLAASLHERGATAGAGQHRLRRLLLASELALSLVLLVGAGLMIRTFAALRAVETGFDSSRVVSAVVSTTGAASAIPARRAAFFQALVDEVKRLPGVVSASAINHLPLAGDNWNLQFHVEGRPVAPDEVPTATFRVVLPGYFRTMGLALLRGRDFERADDVTAPGVVIVNQWLADRAWPGQDPIGKRITFDEPGPAAVWLTVVGVAANAVRADLQAPPADETYVPYLQGRRYLDSPRSAYTYLTLVARTSADPATVGPALRSAAWRLDGDVTVSDVQTMEEVLDASTASPRFYSLLLATFAAVALVLAAVGVYGVTSYTVARRRNEMGIRMALGARPGDLVRMILGEAAVVAAVGAAAGLAAALALGRLMSRLLFGVDPTDPATFAAVCAILAAVALLATWLPARRATRIDPLVALRAE